MHLTKSALADSSHKFQVAKFYLPLLKLSTQPRLAALASIGGLLWSGGAQRKGRCLLLLLQRGSTKGRWRWLLERALMPRGGKPCGVLLDWLLCSRVGRVAIWGSRRAPVSPQTWGTAGWPSAQRTAEGQATKHSGGAVHAAKGRSTQAR